MNSKLTRLLPLLFLCLVSAFVAQAKPPKIAAIADVITGTGDANIIVVFKGPISANPGDAAVTPAAWTVIVGYDNAAPATFTPDGARAGCLLWSIVVTVNSLTGVPSWNHISSIAVYFGGAQAVAPVSQPTAKNSKSYFTPAASQSVADNYLTGSYSPAIHSAPQYSISGLGTVAPQIAKNVYLGATASVKTDNRPSADPDSFFVSALLQWIPKSKPFWGSRARAVMVDWDAAGLQFDRSTTTKTFISTATMEIPILIYPAPVTTAPVVSGHAGNCTITNGMPRVQQSRIGAGIFPYVGVSVGTNISNSLEPNGSGFVFDGNVGGIVDFTFAVPRWIWLQKVELTGTDTLRLPATNEIFTYTHYISQTGKTVSLPELSTRLRNHVKGELDLTIAKPFSISIQYEDGELPPAYKTINNKVTIGVKIALQQSKGANTKMSTNPGSQ